MKVAPVMKRCSKCYRIKPVSDFGNHKNGRDGLRSRCKACNRVEARKSYRKNPEPYKRRARVFRKESAEAVKEWLRAVKVKYGCFCCREQEAVVLDFHHVREKDIAVTTAASKGVLAVERELKKCVVLCANCHRKVHAGLVVLKGMKPIQDKFERSSAARITYKPLLIRRTRV